MGWKVSDCGGDAISSGRLDVECAGWEDFPTRDPPENLTANKTPGMKKIARLHQIDPDHPDQAKKRRNVALLTNG